MHVVIFEASRWHHFAPLSLSRPLFMMASGASTLLHKQIRHLRPDRLTLWVRPELEQFCRVRIAPRTGVPTEVNRPLDEEPALLVNGRMVHFERLEYPPYASVMLDDEDVVRLAYTQNPGLSPEDARQRSEKWLGFKELPRMPNQGRLVDSIADLVHWNDESLMEDFAHLGEASQPKPQGPYHLMNDADVWFGKDTKVSPGCVIDASKGPVIVSDGATVGANAVIQGPCYIGPHATIMSLAHIRPGTSIGMMSKVGGEVSLSIIMGQSNKAHFGYLGHSYIGKWVNLGAGTTTSNLKNTYGPIDLKTKNRTIAEGWRFLGSFIGDHAKTGIQTRLMSGTYVGFSSMLAGAGTAPKLVPSYSFWTDKGIEPYRMAKAIEVAERVFARRDREWTSLDEQIMRYVAETAPAVED